MKKFYKNLSKVVFSMSRKKTCTLYLSVVSFLLGVFVAVMSFFLMDFSGISFVIGSFIDRDLDKDAIETKSLIQSESILENKVRHVSNISIDLNTLILTEDLLVKAEKEHNILKKPLSRKELILKLNSHENVFKDRDPLDIVISYIERFGKFKFAGKSRITSRSKLESISIFVSAAHKDFLWYACFFEGIGTWYSDLSLRREDIDNLTYELRIEDSTGLDTVINRLERDGLLDYRLRGQALEYCELKGWVTGIKDIPKLSESRLYGLLIVTFDVEQYQSDFGIKWQLVLEHVSKQSNDTYGLKLRSAIYDALIKYIGISCIKSTTSIKIKGKDGMRLFLAKWGFSLMGGPYRVCLTLCRFYGLYLRNNQLCIGSRTLDWSSCALLIEEIRFERYRVPRGRRMELIHMSLFEDFISMSFDFTSRDLVFFYSIWSFGLGVKFKRDWDQLDKQDLFECTREHKKIVLENHHLFLIQQHESVEERNVRKLMYGKWSHMGRFDVADMFRDGVEYPGSLDHLRNSIHYRSKYQVGYLSPTSNIKVGNVKHKRLANYYVGMRVFYKKDRGIK